MCGGVCGSSDVGACSGDVCAYGGGVMCVHVVMW